VVVVVVVLLLLLLCPMGPWCFYTEPKFADAQLPLVVAFAGIRTITK
jgi:hypothetical protein